MAASRDPLLDVSIDNADAVFPFDYRGIRSAARRLPADAYLRAGRALLARRAGVVLITTGFPFGSTGETDGPPGARAVAGALKALGWQIVTVACPATHAVVEALLGRLGPVELVEGESPAAARAGCERVLRTHVPDVAIAIERPGVTADGRLVNMRGEQLHADTAALDALMQAPLSIAIADGGNEIGMGAVAGYLARHRLVAAPCITRTTHLLLASVSTWGAYGLVAMLDLLSGIESTPTGSDERDWLQRLLAAGAVDGVSGRPEPTVDTFTADRTEAVLERLRAIRRRHTPLPLTERRA